MNHVAEKPRNGLGEILSNLVSRSTALTAVIVTKQGISISSAGDTSYLNITAMGALVAGMFSATREVARMVGEKQFSILLQQGENRHIHISLVRDSTMMVVIFEDFRRIGLVRHEAKKAAGELNTVLAAAHRPKEGPQEIASTQFKEYALNLIDEIFQPR
jgi:predicted regulator of Ras-like GTPase activity (Roadblock/LC7/MglB family)